MSDNFNTDPAFKKNRIKTIIWIIVGVICLSAVTFIIIHYVTKANELNSMQSSASMLADKLPLWLKN